MTWTVNDTSLTTSEDGRISSDGDSLIFSPLTTSDTGNYTCTLTLSPQTPHVTVQGPAESEEEVIIVQSVTDHEEHPPSDLINTAFIIVSVVVVVIILTIAVLVITVFVVKSHKRVVPNRDTADR